MPRVCLELENRVFKFFTVHYTHVGMVDKLRVSNTRAITETAFAKNHTTACSIVFLLYHIRKLQNLARYIEAQLTTSQL